jgi:antitoxin component YwqK of YwqJK toxin-antitoxin module
MPKKLIFVILITFIYLTLNAQDIQKDFYDEAKTQVKSEINFVNGKREGSAKTFYENGKTKQEATFKDDKKVGPYTEYYDNGNKKLECIYVNGFISGIYKEYHSNGNLKLLTRYYKQIDDSKEAPVFVQKKATILTFTEYEYFDDGKTVRRKKSMAIYRTVKNKENGKAVFDVFRAGSGTETYYLLDGTVEFEKEYLNDRVHGEAVMSTRVPAETTQLISDGGVTAEITDGENLPE